MKRAFLLSLASIIMTISLSIVTLSLPAFSQTGSFKKGDQVEVQWQGEWWEAIVIDLRCNLYKIHYQGFDSSWDEWVEKARIREPRKRSLKKMQVELDSHRPSVRSQVSSSTVASLEIAIAHVLGLPVS